jgi:rare lipoprotein A
VNAIETGVASWYGPDFHGRQTANGEKYDMNGLTAAHRTLPFDTQVLVENLDNGKTVRVRINDRGPFAKDRIIDLSKGAAEKVDMIGPGTARVRIYLMNGDTFGGDIKRAKYTVQLGSYESRELAEQKAAEIRSSYVQEINVSGKKVYRIYFGDFDDPKIALEALNRLEGLGHDGFVKQIDH